MLSRLRSFMDALCRRERFEDTLATELRHHLEAYTDDLVGRGVPPDEARRRARVDFGGVERVKDACREARGLRLVDELRLDARVGLRALRRTPLLSATAILTIGLASGLAMLTFCIVYGALLRPLPFAHGDRIMALEPVHAEFEALDLRDFRERQRSFDEVEGYLERSVALMGPGRPAEALRAAFVTAGALDLLGVSPLLGRTFRDGEDFRFEIGHVVIGERLWRSHFDGTADIVGSLLDVDGRRLEVVGVMPAGFRFPVDQDLWLPMDFDLPADDERGSGRSFIVFGRLRDGVTEAMANAEARILFPQIWGEATFGVSDARQVFPLADLYLPVGFDTLLFTAILAAAGVLIVGCANVANLLLVRSMAQRSEVALRVALGAGGSRIARQFILESFLLAAPGTVLGLWLAAAGVRVFAQFEPSLGLPYWVQIRLDTPAWLVAGMLTVVVAVSTALLPALRASRPLEGQASIAVSRISTPRQRRASGCLVVSQVAVSCAFMIATGLLVRSALNLRGLDLGFDAEPVFSAIVALPASDRPDPVGTLMTLIERTEELPGVASASLARAAPGIGPVFEWRFAVDGEVYTSGREEYPRASGTPVAHGYFETMGIALLQGRDFRAAESRFGTQPVLIANRTLAERYLGPAPVGRRIRIGDSDEGDWLPVVGVVADTYVGSRSGGIGMTAEAVPQLYVSWGVLPYSAATLLVRSHSDAPELQVPFVREVLAELAPAVPLQRAGPLSPAIRESTWAVTLLGMIFTVFGCVTLLMSGVGLFTVLAFAVRERTREIGVRLALGARIGDIRRLVTRTVAAQMVAGLAAGVGLSVLLGRSIELVLFDVSATDLRVYAAVVASMLVVAALAALAPVRAAARVDPVTVLRT